LAKAAPMFPAPMIPIFTEILRPLSSHQTAQIQGRHPS
jgi:hypothetical protein